MRFRFCFFLAGFSFVFDFFPCRLQVSDCAVGSDRCFLRSGSVSCQPRRMISMVFGSSFGWRRITFMSGPFAVG